MMAFLEMKRQNNMKNSFHEINRHCIRTASKIKKKKKSVKLPKIREEAMP